MSSYQKAKTDDYDTNPEKTKCQKFLSSIYNDRKGTFLGRTAKSWGLIFVFYLIFYSCLSGFFLGMISVFMYGFVSKTEPMRTGRNSILTFTPGVNANPRFSNESALIIASSDPSSKAYNAYISLAESFLNKTVVSRNSDASVECDETKENTPKDLKKFCKFNLNLLGPCASPRTELDAGRLCIYIRPNRIYGWLPQIENSSLSNDILLECDGQNPGDSNNLGKPIYYPSLTNSSKKYGRIPNMFYPFVMQKDYSAPMVAVQFPQMTRNLAILVQCSLRNIRNSYKPVKFEIMLTNK